MIRWLRKWIAFFRPMPSWAKRLRDYRGGKTAWAVPGKPECNQVIPWPLAWIPHTIPAEIPETWAEKDHVRGFDFVDEVCVDTGQTVKPGVGVCCVRCGVALHPDVSHQSGSFDPPRCRRCKWFVS